MQIEKRVVEAKKEIIEVPNGGIILFDKSVIHPMFENHYFIKIIDVEDVAEDNNRLCRVVDLATGDLLNIYENFTVMQYEPSFDRRLLLMDECKSMNDLKAGDAFIIKTKDPKINVDQLYLDKWVLIFLKINAGVLSDKYNAVNLYTGKLSWIDEDTGIEDPEIFLIINQSNHICFN